MKLRTHLIVLTLATVVPAVLFAVGLIVYQTRLERLSLERGMRDTARALALALDRDINDIKTGIETLSASKYLNGPADLAHFYEEGTTVSKGFGGWAVLSDPSGRQILNTSRPLGAALPIPTMASLEMMRSVANGRTIFVSNVFVGPLRSAMTSLKITPLHPSIGAEISGIDLSRPIDAPMRQALSQALADHLALVFREQTLTPSQYLAAASAFGPPMEQHYSQHNMPEFPLIGLIWHKNGQQPAERWHTDHTTHERPPAATILYGVEIPSAGGGTSVANMRAAYVALPEGERRRLDTLKTSNSLDRDKTDTRQDDIEKYGKPIEHPMVRTHPVHGSRAVYFHITKATHIEGMTPEASRAYMNDLLERMIRPEITYHHAWRKGDVLVIDDRATMHRAHGDRKST